MHDHPAPHGRGPHRGRPRLLAGVGPLRRVPCPGGRSGHGWDRQGLQGDVELLGVHRRRPRPGPVGRRRPHRHGVRPVPPDGHGVAAVGARHPRHRGGAGATAACSATPRGERFMFRYIPEMFRAETAETEEEADRWYTDRSARRTPDLLPRDEVARAINTEIKEGRGSPHGGVYLDIATRRDPDVHHAPAAGDVPPVPRAGRRRHHQGADGGGPHLPLHDGWRAGGRRDPGLHRAGSLRRRRGRRRHARRQPPGRQLAVGPAGVRPAGRAGRSRVRGGGARSAPW